MQGDRERLAAANEEVERLRSEHEAVQGEVERCWRYRNELEAEVTRLRSAAARALERTQVDDSGEATMILEQVVNLDGSPVAPRT